LKALPGVTELSADGALSDVKNHPDFVRLEPLHGKEIQDLAVRVR